MLKNLLSLFLLFYLLSHNHGYSQDYTFEKSLYDSVAKYNYTDTLKRSFYNTKYLEFGKRENRYKDVFMAYNNLLSWSYEDNDSTSFFRYTDTLLNISKKGNLPIEMMKTYHLKATGITHFKGYDDTRILKNFDKGIKLAKELNNKVWQCKFNKDIANYYFRTEQFDEAFHRYKSIIKELESVRNTEDYEKYQFWGIRLDRMYLTMSSNLLEIKDTVNAQKYNNRFYKTYKNDSATYLNFSFYWYHLNNLDINIQKNEIEKAKLAFEKAKKIDLSCCDTDDSKYIIEHYYDVILAYKQHNYKDCLEHYRNCSKEIFEKYFDKNFFDEDYFKALHSSSLQLNNKELASIHFDNLINYLEKEKYLKKSIRSILESFENEKQQKEIEFLENETKTQKKVLIISLIIFIAPLLVLLIYYRYDHLKNKQKVKELLQKRTISNKSAKKSPEITIRDAEVNRVLKKLDKLEDENYFLRIDCTQASIAKKIKTNTTYLSKIINQHYQKSFTNYLNDLRINYVIDKLKNDKVFRNYSIKSISNDIGFKSKESFNKAFKKRTGVLPSFFIKEIKKTLHKEN